MKMSVFHRVRTLTVPTFLLAAAGHGQVLAADGTIHFVGAIVAEPYEITHAAAPPAIGRIHAGTGSDVVFERQWIDRPSARVSIQSLGAQPLAMAFTDSGGRRRGVAPLGEFAVGRDGGSLSLAPMRAPGPAAALLTVAYD
ncbi:hypothetical protein [Variovorax sp. OV329]|uniref:hypothetical protein n=1 Tax=Variovorax sp. OV329 TaxID=1882825 RepID=UPI0008EAE2E3|nr:hypothetical protein [Variovorax sp. OV329]SFM63601.1 hypothetical protein SAMN05444747_10786 [Variovorax sp. OV329]